METPFLEWFFFFWMARPDLKLAGNTNVVLTMKMLMLKDPATEIFPLFNDSAFFYGLPLSYFNSISFFHKML